MMIHWEDLAEEDRRTFGNGCTFVPDFIFTASCQIHDFVYSRGGSLWYKFRGDWHMASKMWSDSYLGWHYIVTIVYWLGLTLLPIPYIIFTYGRWRTIEEILIKDKKNASRRL